VDGLQNRSGHHGPRKFSALSCAENHLSCYSGPLGDTDEATRTYARVYSGCPT
jgi:hypothetical protein